MTFVMASSARGGARSGLAAALGIGAGTFVHILAAVVGLSALIASSETAFSVLKWLGAAYLLWLGIGMLRTGKTGEPPVATTPARSHLATFRAAALVNVLNPKVGLFFLAFLPQFVDPRAEVPALQIAALGLWFDLVGTLVNAVVAIAAALTAAHVRNLAWAGRAARWLGATAMGGLAVQLMLAERR
jgi:threonine/homoserine/homoserine lactone efflux protein